ncbi:glycoside hydrolase family protein [Rhizorhapis suberifaciens]|uniref:Lysozyme n=1 Tax=Rhizorhapis suberifaciens TaxID=13656 RepID=A0A840HXK4_9SPHN|nr:glycoside hydrolase family protein [Rhizorhapis suberifaciens]MBB4642381.1 lysozyme [Rhizorhapis suberifaciens]
MNVRQLQERLGVTADGIIGPATLSAVNAALDAKAQANDPIITLATKHLNREEGRIPHAYQDHIGFWTIGVGRLIDKRKGGRLTDEEIDYLLANDIRRFMNAMKDWPAWQAVKDDPVRAVALLSMCFQLGVQGLAGFKNSLDLVAQKRWDEAAANMMQSKWAKQTPARAKRVTAMLETGVYQA